MTVLPAEERYDAIIIGSGQAGTPLAHAIAAELKGSRTALIERRHVGGTCINEGCTPTKTMVASARIAYLARRAADYGVRTGPVSVDLSRVRQRKRDVVDRFRSSGERRLAQRPGITLIAGEAQFAGPSTVEVRLPDGGVRRLRADWIFINTGARPRVPPVPGLDRMPFLDSTSIMELDIVPEHLLILGGGYVGLEFGQMFRRFGSRVTIVQRAGQLLRQEDADIAEEVRTILKDDGVDILLSSAAVEAGRGTDGRLRLLVRTPEGDRTLDASHLLVAAGRVPNTEGLNLAAAGVQTDAHGHVVANERLETTAPGVFALGDVKGGPAFTHISYDDYRIIRTNLLRGGRQGPTTTAGRLLPYTVYIDPQLGRVGLTERDARERGLPVHIARLPMGHVARAIEVGETRGVMKAVVDAGTDQILGAAVLGVEGGEIASLLQMAIIGRVPYTALKDLVFTHPTLAEALNNL